MAISPGVQYLVTGSPEGLIVLDDFLSSTPSFSDVSSASGPICSVDVSPSGLNLLGATVDGKIVVGEWNGQERSIRYVQTLQGNGTHVVAAKFTKDGERVISALEGGEVRVWDLKSGLGQVLMRGSADISTYTILSRRGEYAAIVHGSEMDIWSLIP